MADLLIPLLILFVIVGGVLVAALVHQLRDLEGGSGRSFGGGGGPDPVLPWRREKPDRPGPPAGRRSAPPDRPTLPWQRGEEQTRTAPARTTAQPADPAPTAPQPAAAQPAPQPGPVSPAARPTRSDLGQRPASPAAPAHSAGQSPRRRRPRQPAWLKLPGDRGGKDARARPAPRPAPAPGQAARAEQDSAPDRPAPLWQRPRADSPDGRSGAAPSSERCSTCGGTGEAIVRNADGGLQRGRCPVCQA